MPTPTRAPGSLSARLSRSLVLWVCALWLMTALGTTWYVRTEVNDVYDSALGQLSAAPGTAPPDLPDHQPRGPAAAALGRCPHRSAGARGALRLFRARRLACLQPDPPHPPGPHPCGGRAAAPPAHPDRHRAVAAAAPAGPAAFSGPADPPHHAARVGQRGGSRRPDPRTQ